VISLPRNFPRLRVVTAFIPGVGETSLRRALTRERVVSEAFTVIGADGLEAPGMRGIAVRLGVDPGALAGDFRSSVADGGTASPAVVRAMYGCDKSRGSAALGGRGWAGGSRSGPWRRIRSSAIDVPSGVPGTNQRPRDCVAWAAVTIDAVCARAAGLAAAITPSYQRCRSSKTRAKC
jgi:hypothetical protein